MPDVCIRKTQPLQPGRCGKPAGYLLFCGPNMSSSPGETPSPGPATPWCADCVHAHTDHPITDVPDALEWRWVPINSPAIKVAITTAIDAGHMVIVPSDDPIVSTDLGLAPTVQAVVNQIEDAAPTPTRPDVTLVPVMIYQEAPSGQPDTTTPPPQP